MSVITGNYFENPYCTADVIGLLNHDEVGKVSGYIFVLYFSISTAAFKLGLNVRNIYEFWF